MLCFLTEFYAFYRFISCRHVEWLKGKRQTIATSYLRTGLKTLKSCQQRKVSSGRRLDVEKNVYNVNNCCCRLCPCPINPLKCCSHSPTLKELFVFISDTCPTNQLRFTHLVQTISLDRPLRIPKYVN